MDPVLHAAYVMSSIWLGDSYAAKDMDLLGNLDISIIINLSGFDDEPIEDVDIHTFMLLDNNLMENEIDRAATRIASIAECLNAAVETGRKILVHDGKECVNRAPIAIAFYMIKYRGYSVKDAINIVRKANESREKEFSEYPLPDGTKELRPRHIRTFTNQSFCKILMCLKK